MMIAAAVCSLLMYGGIASSGSSVKMNGAGPLKVNANDRYRPFLINQVFNYFGNNGEGSYNPYSSDNEGFEYPKGSPHHTIMCCDGVLWGGYHKGRSTPKVGGSYYRPGLQAGKILTPGTATADPVADDPSLAEYRIYRVRPDINPHKTFAEVQQQIDNTETPFIGRFETYSSLDIYNQYLQDWDEWPARDGAPFEDVDSNGVYDPAVDVPGQPGSDQTLWYVANDCDSSRTLALTGSPVIGLEMQRTIWGYRRTGVLGSTIFESTKLINKSGAPVDTMYLVQWADPDLGVADDDFVGCDTTTLEVGGSPRNLGFVYNGEPYDDFFRSTVLPAGGFALLQGPIQSTGNPADSALFELKYRHGYRNLRMTSFDYTIHGIIVHPDPVVGQRGDSMWYRLMTGFEANGNPFVDPTTGQVVKFALAGDPVAGTGWIDGIVSRYGDRRVCLVSGPLTMAPGDTQEIVVANLAGLGADRLSSISVLRAYTDTVQATFNNLFRRLPGVKEQDPTEFSVSQNYPNPFNLSTTIRYALPHSAFVTLTVYNILGQQVAQLLNQQMPYGFHEVQFRGDALASGVYFYRIQIGGFSQINKLMLLK